MYTNRPAATPTRAVFWLLDVELPEELELSESLSTRSRFFSIHL